MGGDGAGAGAVVAAAVSAAAITLLDLLFDGSMALVMTSVSVRSSGSSSYSSSHISLEPTWGFRDVSWMGGSGGWYSPVGVSLICGCAGEHGFVCVRAVVVLAVVFNWSGAYSPFIASNSPATPLCLSISLSLTPA